MQAEHNTGQQQLTCMARYCSALGSITPSSLPSLYLMTLQILVLLYAGNCKVLCSSRPNFSRSDLSPLLIAMSMSRDPWTCTRTHGLPGGQLHKRCEGHKLPLMCACHSMLSHVCSPSYAVHSIPDNMGLVKAM